MDSVMFSVLVPNLAKLPQFDSNKNGTIQEKTLRFYMISYSELVSGLPDAIEETKFTGHRSCSI
jgi:hypothetical protein